MYALTKLTHDVRRDSRGFTVATDDGFELWRGLAPEAVRVLTARLFDGELGRIERLLEQERE